MTYPPKISVITPSFNQGHFLEQTILSILNQDYLNLEYIIIDGGSNDQSISIIERYATRLSFWVSEQDNGQGHAINKGFQKATGDIIGWINSDDLLLPNTLNTIAKLFIDHNPAWITGDCIEINEHSVETGRYTTELPNTLYDWLNLFARGFSYSIIQPATFWTREALDNVGLLNEKWHYSFDHEFFFRLFKHYGSPLYINQPLAAFRIHSQSKTSTSAKIFMKENKAIAAHHISALSLNQQLKLRLIKLLK